MSAVFTDQVDRILRNFHRQVFVSDFRLAGKTRVRFQPPGTVEHVFFFFTHFRQGIETLPDDDVTGAAGAAFTAGVFDFDVVVQQGIANGLA